MKIRSTLIKPNEHWISLAFGLAEQRFLAEKMFSYYQNGMQGLIPDLTKDFTIPLITGEVYYQLGFIN